MIDTALRSLALSGYRSYNNDLEQNTIDFHDINIIIGANGAGKSNLISFLEMVSYMMSGGLSRYVAKQGGAQSLLHCGVNHVEQICGKIQIHDCKRKKEDTYSFSLEQTATNQLFFVSEQLSFKDDTHDAPYTKSLGSGHYEAKLADEYESTARILRNYLDRLKIFHFNDTSISSHIRGSARTSDGSYLRSDGGNIAAFLHRMRETEAEIPYYERIVRHIRMVLPQFFDFVLEPDIAGNFSLNWKQVGVEETFGPHQFSDGALRFVALTTLLLQSARTAPMTIILDEPEIGLHPYAISQLAREIRMASKTSQIIVSTQSPLLLNEFSCDDIITAEYDTVKQRSTLRRHKESDLKEWLNNYTLGELWQKNVLGGLPL